MQAGKRTRNLGDYLKIFDITLSVMQEKDALVFVAATVLAIRLPPRVDSAQGEEPIGFLRGARGGETPTTGRRGAVRIPASMAFAPTSAAEAPPAARTAHTNRMTIPTRFIDSSSFC